jgi:hypothetical protein
MENESNLGQPIPTAVFTPMEIVSPSNPGSEVAGVEPAMEAMATAWSGQSTMLFAEMMFAPLAYWASLSAPYFRLLDMAAKPAAWARIN